MFVNKEVLEQYHACGAGLSWFERYFPNGAELIDVINHKYVSTHTLHWGFANLPTSDEEKAAYKKKLNINCGKQSDTIYFSNNISDSEYVSHSFEVDNSQFVFYSSHVQNCNNILRSNTVENSSLVYSSDFVFDSNKVLNGRNVNASQSIINADYVINSHHVYGATAITNSAYVGGFGLNFGETNQIKDSYFISNCRNLQNCLFCYGINDKNYILFNKQIDEMQYTMIVKQMNSILKDWQPVFVVDLHWPEGTIPLDAPTLQRNVAKQYETLPIRFWQWVKTLPNYDPAILYAITYNKELI